MRHTIYKDGQKLYSYGLPFSEDLARNIDELIKRVEGNKAALIVIDGGQGEGKSTLAVHLIDYINKKYRRPATKLDRFDHPQLSMGGREFAKNLIICYKEKLPAVCYDEAGDFNRRGSITRFNAQINRIFETFRGYRVIVILCLPSFQILDTDLCDKKIPRLLLHLTGRTQNQGNFMGYSLKGMLWVKHKMGKCVIKEQAFGYIVCNFHGHFLDLSKDRGKLLDKICLEGKEKIAKIARVEQDGLLTIPQIAERSGLGDRQIYKLIKELKIREDFRQDGSRYFKPSIVETLQDYRDNITDKKGRVQV